MLILVCNVMHLNLSTINNAMSTINDVIFDKHHFSAIPCGLWQNIFCIHVHQMFELSMTP